MSEPLSKKLDIYPIEEGTIVSGLMNGRECDAYIEGHNKVVRKLDQLSPDIELLAQVRYKKYPYEGWFVVGEEAAQEIINKMSVWIVKESSGQCNHEFMQQYDFSKFSNAGNSLKCVKCGLIKKG